MEKMILTDLNEEKKGTKKIYCAKCHKEIKKVNINNAFKITIGLIMKYDFIPGEKSVFFHQECL
jgi:hypothetical protein